MNMKLLVSATVVTCYLSMSAIAQPTAFDRAWEFRDQIGLSPADLAAMRVDAQTQDQLTTLIRDALESGGTVSDAQQAAPSPSDAIDGLTQAERALTEGVSWGRDPREAFDRVWAARAALIEALQPLSNAAREALPEQLRPYVARAVANAGIDSPYRLLDLTPEQRAKITSLQEQQARVTRDARQWHKLKHLAAVQDRFAKEVRGLLTAEQQAEVDRLNRNIEANLDAVWQVELASYPLAEVAEVGVGAADPTYADWAGQLLADPTMFLSRARTLFDGKRLGGSLALPQEAFQSRARTLFDRLTAALAALTPAPGPARIAG